MGHPLLSRFSRDGRPNRELTIRLSIDAVPENWPVGTAVGLLSVANGKGVYTFAITEDLDDKFELVGSVLKLKSALDYETDDQHRVVIEASNGVDAPVQQRFSINVTNLIEGTLGPISAEFFENDEIGTVVAQIQGLDIGANERIVSMAPNDGRLVLIGDDYLVVGLTAASVGAINVTLTTTEGRTLAMAVTVKA